MKLGNGSVAGMLIALLWPPLLGRADFSSYRGFQLEGNAGTKSTGVTSGSHAARF